MNSVPSSSRQARQAGYSQVGIMLSICSICSGPLYEEGETPPEIPPEHSFGVLAYMDKDELCTWTGCGHIYHGCCVSKFIYHKIKQLLSKNDEELANVQLTPDLIKSVEVKCPNCNSSPIFVTESTTFARTFVSFSASNSISGWLDENFSIFDRNENKFAEKIFRLCGFVEEGNKYPMRRMIKIIQKMLLNKHNTKLVRELRKQISLSVAKCSASEKTIQSSLEIIEAKNIVINDLRNTLLCYKGVVDASHVIEAKYKEKVVSLTTQLDTVQKMTKSESAFSRKRIQELEEELANNKIDLSAMELSVSEANARAEVLCDSEKDIEEREAVKTKCLEMTGRLEILLTKVRIELRKEIETKEGLNVLLGTMQEQVRVEVGKSENLTLQLAKVQEEQCKERTELEKLKSRLARTQKELRIVQIAAKEDEEHLRVAMKDNAAKFHENLELVSQNQETQAQLKLIRTRVVEVEGQLKEANDKASEYKSRLEVCSITLNSALANINGFDVSELLGDEAGAGAIVEENIVIVE